MTSGQKRKICEKELLEKMSCIMAAASDNGVLAQVEECTAPPSIPDEGLHE